jgi:UDP-glucose 4-epimerase
MILLDCPDSSRRRHVIAIFGVGLIGSAILESLRRRGAGPSARMPLDWADQDSEARQIGEIELLLGAKAAEAGGVSIVWSAGRASFSSTAEEVDRERESFRSVLAMSQRVANQLRSGKAHFVLLSSAGGLFEGQRIVGAASTPSPRRPYGILKWDEERLLEAASPALTKSILRLSSVFGRVRSGHRSGLIPTLVANGIRRRVSSIVGNMSTLRDFIWADDVAEFVARRILESPDRRDVSKAILASSRPASILEVRKMVEDRLGYSIYVACARDGGNRDDITFSSSSRPPNWSPSDLKTSVSAVYRDALSFCFG